MNPPGHLNYLFGECQECGAVLVVEVDFSGTIYSPSGVPEP